MKIYWKCACCNKPQNKIQELKMGAGWKPEMFRCLDTWLKKIQQDLDWKNKDNEKKRKKERVEMTLDTFEGEPKKVPWIIQERYVPENKREKRAAEVEAVGWEDEFTTYSPADAWRDWEKIDPYFKKRPGESEATAKMRVLDWMSEPKPIRYAECKEWIDAGFKGGDALFVRWLRDKGLNADVVLNHGSYEDLKAEYDELNKPDDIDTEE